MCSPGCPGTHYVDQAGLKLRDLPASASGVLGLKVCTTTRLEQSFQTRYCVSGTKFGNNFRKKNQPNKLGFAC